MLIADHFFSPGALTVETFCSSHFSSHEVGKLMFLKLLHVTNKLIAGLYCCSLSGTTNSFNLRIIFFKLIKMSLPLTSTKYLLHTYHLLLLHGLWHLFNRCPSFALSDSFARNVKGKLSPCVTQVLLLITHENMATIKYLSSVTCCLSMSCCWHFMSFK